MVFNIFIFYLFTVPIKEKFLLVVEGEFQITNIPYTIGFVNRNSSEFLALSANITTQVIIDFSRLYYTSLFGQSNDHAEFYL